MRQRVTPIAVALLASALAGCGSSGDGASGTRAGSASETAEATESLVVAQTKQMGRGERALLLRIPRVGRLVARCDEDGEASLAFVAAFVLPTSAVTVDKGGPNPVRKIVHPGQRVTVLRAVSTSDFQTWQIEPFAKAGVRVTTIWVAMGRSPGAPAYACGFSAHAMTTSEPPSEENP